MPPVTGSLQTTKEIPPSFPTQKQNLEKQINTTQIKQSSSLMFFIFGGIISLIILLGIALKLKKKKRFIHIENSNEENKPKKKKKPLPDLYPF